MKFIDSPWTVEVEEGDTLGSIAERVAGGDWRRLYAINKERILAEQRKRGIKREHILRMIRPGPLSPPIEAHLIYPRTLLLCP